MFRSLHMKLVLIMVLLIVSLMTVVGAFLMTSITDFYVDAFYQQMESVFGDSNPSNAAFVDWRREGRRFPVPADILDRLPACRAALSAAAPQPEGNDTTHTPGYPSFLAARRRGDDEALARLEQTYGKDAMRRFETMLAGVVEACDVRQ